MFKKIFSSALVIVLVLFCGIVLSMSLRGLPGNPTSLELNNNQWKDDGPLELSPERGRFALTYSLIEDKSFFFSLPIARFATPDLGYKNGNFVSLFAPGVSFLVIPGYLLGKIFGASQVGTYAMVSFFAVLNVLLIRAIAIRLGANKLAASLGALVFIFATPAFPYAVTLYQHHISVFLMLLGIYALLKFQKIWSLSIIWFLSAVSISVDYPNFFMMLPIGLYALGKIFVIKYQEDKVKFSIKVLGFVTIFAAVIPLVFFLWFNNSSYGSPFQLAGTVASVKEIDSQGKPAAPKGTEKEEIAKLQNPDLQTKTAVNFFKTRNMLGSLFSHFLSFDRGIIVYTPVILFGFIGFILSYKKKVKGIGLVISVMAANIVLYSMWEDFWGGWAFGSRYMIPTYAMSAIFIGLLLTYWRRYSFFLIFFSLFLIYSIAVNTMGAITSNRNPPQVEVLALEKLSGQVEKYTYTRNVDYLNSNQSKSFVFQTYANKYLTAWQYYQLLFLSISLVSLGMLLWLRVMVKGDHNEKF